MSLERAHVNCKRCYGLAMYVLSDSRNKSPSDEDNKNNLLHTDPLYIARNDTLRALEDMAHFAITASIDDPKLREKVRSDGIMAETYLRACKSCDYSKPLVAEQVDNHRKVN